jgi:hypothetical protein
MIPLHPFALTRTVRQGVFEGELGVVAARAGVGKSACLVQIAASELVEGRQVLHVSLENRVNHVRRRYDELLDGLQRDLRLAVHDLRFLVERNRHIHSYLGQSFTPAKLLEALEFLRKYMDFDPQLVILDGYPFATAELDELAELQRLAVEQKLQFWFSALTHRHESYSDEELPSPLTRFGALLGQVVHLEPVTDGVRVRLWQRPPVDAEASGWSELPHRLRPEQLLLTRAG